MATAPAKRACPVCGALLADDSAYCPVCALQQALGTQTYSDSNSTSELRFEHYTVLQNAEGKPFELGHGGMGVTYKAFDVHLQCPVALKIINAQLFGNESARLRFVREARAAASVRHQNVASVFHIGESGGNYYYAMEFVEGETLAALIRRLGPLETDLALEIIGQIAAGLAAIEKQHLVHRDIKPSNIMVSVQGGKLGSVKIIDLGLAKGVAEENTLSTVGAFIGTPAYASPEQFAGIATDIRSDLYSLGITLWEMLSGKLPFSGSAAELMYQHQHAEPSIQKLTSVSKPVIALLQVLLAKDPNQRFQSPAQLQNALPKVREAIGSGLGLTAHELRAASAQVAESVPKGRPRKQAIRWVMAASLCFAGLLLAWFFVSGHSGFLFNRRIAEAVPTQMSVAVLPFESLSESKSDAYFADGVQDEILNNLAKIAQLKVICRTSVMQYRADAKRDLLEIANALGVANVLEGTVRRDGNHVRVSTELVDARNQNTIWADSYDRDLTDIFAIQSEIAQNVASRLSAQLSSEERKDIEEKPTNNLEAYDLYLQAKQLLAANYWDLSQNSEKEIYSKIISLLEDATRKDHKFALAYCLLTKAHDILYVDGVDHTPERRALGDTAANEALRLRPDLPEAHLAMAFHLYYCYRDFERARVQIAIGAQTLPNNPDLLELTALIDRVQGRWEKSTAGLERAATLDPRSLEILGYIQQNYTSLRRYPDQRRILDRLNELQPDPLNPVYKAKSFFYEKADVKGVRAAYEALPSSIKADPEVTQARAYFALCERDFAAAEEIVNKSPNEEIQFTGALVPRQIETLWIEFIQGKHPTMEQFGAAREQLYRTVEAEPSNPNLMTALAYADLALGRTEESIQEGRRAMELRPISEDAYDGPNFAMNVAEIYALTNQPNMAFEQLNILAKIPCSLLNYGNLKTNPSWDPLRKDPRFDKLLAELAPHD